MPLTTSTALGASIGDFLTQSSHTYDRLGLGTTTVSSIFFGLILALVAYLSISRRDQPSSEPA